MNIGIDSSKLRRQKAKKIRQRRQEEEWNE